jgi:hypothetical protein
MKSKFDTVSRISLAATIICVLLAGSARLLMAQTTTGALSGTVHDPSNAAVPGATVKLVNVDTNESRSVSTNEIGLYSFQLLPPATYRLEVEKEGFKHFIRDEVKIDIALQANVDIQLDLGQSTETVSVTGSAPLLESSQGSIGTEIENRSIVDLPLNGRNSYSFTALVPGIRASFQFTQVSYGMYNEEFISINGSRTNQNVFLLDGGINTSVNTTGPGYFPSVDLVQEYKVQTNSYSAEYSDTSGGVINVITKSGTNNLHGTLYEFLRNDKLVATPFFINSTGGKAPPFKFNQFGGSIGGPVRLPHYNGKDRTFFFAVYEGLRWIEAAPALASLPTLLQRAGDFSQTRAQNGNPITIYDPATTQPNPSNLAAFIRTPFPGNVIPVARFSRVAQALLAYTPLPNVPGNPVTGLNNFSSAYPNNINKNEVSFRIDHAISDNKKLFGRFSANNTFDGRLNPDYYGPGYAVSSPQNANDQLNQRQTTLNYTQIIRPTIVLEESSSFQKYTLHRVPVGAPFDQTKIGFPSYMNSIPLESCFPSVSVSSLGLNESIPDNASTGLIGDCTGSTFLEDLENMLETVNLSVTHGKHSFKMGGNYGLKYQATGRFGVAAASYSFTAGFTQGPNPQVGSSNAGVGYASYLLGLGTGSIMSSGVPLHVFLNSYGGYFQDTWKVLPKLTVNLGLRYDYNSPWTERNNALSNFNFTAPSPLQIPGLNLIGGLEFPGQNGLPRGQWNGDWNDWQPRVSFAYQLDQSTVISSGFGMFTGPFAAGYNGNAVPNTGFTASTTWASSVNGVTPTNYWDNPYPNGFLYADNGKLGLLEDLGQTAIGMDRNRRAQESEQWNFSIQHILQGNWVIDAVYAGSRGLHLFGTLNADQLPDQYLALGSALTQSVANPFFGLITTGTLSQPTVTESQLLRPYPQFTGVTIPSASYGASTYHSLQVKLDKRFSHGFNLLVAYTWSKLLDDVAGSLGTGESVSSPGIQDFYNRRGDRSYATFDVPQYIAINGNFELPFGPGKKFLNRGVAAAILGGWQINGIETVHSGVPLGFTDNSNTLNNYGGSQRPNVVPGVNILTSGSTASRVNDYLNPAAFTQAPIFTFGDAPREFGNTRAQGQVNLDASLIRNVKVKENLTLQIRAESFNALNHVWFGPPNTVVGGQSFGVISTVTNYPRDNQFALKLIF